MIVTILLILIFLFLPYQPSEVQQTESTKVLSETGSSDIAVKITYIGNEGFLISGRGKKILIDALYREGNPEYVIIPPDRRKRMENARAPFDDIDLILATHYHADHFDPMAVGTHLINNPKAIFVSTNQAVDQLEMEFESYTKIKNRVKAVTPREGERIKMTPNGINLEIIYLHHGRSRPIENLGFIFEISTKKLFHIGDTEASEKDLQIYSLTKDSINIAFLNSWYLIYEEWQSGVKNEIQPDSIIVMHLPSKNKGDAYIESLGGWDTMAQKILKAFPNAYIFEEEMETKIYK